MTFTLPAATDACNLTRSAADPLWVADINSPTNTGVKANGSLPHPDSATEFDNNVNATTKGYAKEFVSGGAGYDVSTNTKLLLWHNQWNAPNRIQVDTVANAGMSLKIFTGTVNGTNWREFYVGGNDTPQGASISGQFPFIIDLNDSSHDATNGTYDNTDVTGIAILQTRLNIAGTNTNWNYQGKMHIIDTTKASSNTPTFSGAGSVIQDIVTEVQGTSFSNKKGSWVRQIGSVIFVDFAFRIGNNSTITEFDDEGKTIISPITNDPADPSKRLTLQACRVYLNLRNNAADTALFTGTWSWGTRAAFDFDQDDSAVVTFTSPTFKGMGTFTVGSSITGAATWDDVDPVITADTGVDIDGSTFKNQNGTHALQLSGGVMDIADMRFETYASAHAIEIDTAGTYEFDNVFFDQSGTNDVENTSGGAVIINVVNGGTVPTVTNTGGGSTTTVNNNVTTLVNVKDNAGVNIQNARVLVETAASGTFPYEASVSITQAAGTATVTHTAHGLATGDFIVIRGAQADGYNKAASITVTTVNAYTYSVNSGLGSPATGTPIASYVAVTGLTDASGNVLDSKTWSTAQAIKGWARKKNASTPFYKDADISDTVSASNGLTVNVVLQPDE